MIHKLHQRFTDKTRFSKKPSDRYQAEVIIEIWSSDQDQLILKMTDQLGQSGLEPKSES